MGGLASEGFAVGTAWKMNSRRLGSDTWFSMIPKFEYKLTGNQSLLVVPYWPAILLSATLATLPWFPSRFSLRTMLIATTLVAVVLGLVVWLGRPT